MAAADSTCVLFAEAAHCDLHVHHVDVKVDYLNASLDTPVDIRSPKGDPFLKGVIWKVHEAVYGLPEAGVRWHELLSKTLFKYGFKPCMIDFCLLMKTQRENSTYVLA
jgi:hypothetical protein